MLQITIPGAEYFDDAKQEFVYEKEQTLQLEHSLVSLSKWESKWKKAFLSGKDKSYEETLDYIKCMTITKNVNPSVYSRLTNENLEQINSYISDPMTATYFPKDETKENSREVVTSELIYYWMIAMNVPPEYQKWHLNRLLSLIRVCEIKNAPPKKMGRKELMSRNAALNAARRKRLNTRG